MRIDSGTGHPRWLPELLPMRTRERAALLIARAALRRIAQAVRDGAVDPAEVAMDALEHMSVTLGERDR